MNTIKIKKYSDVIEEMTAQAAIRPGHLVEINAAGNVQNHSTADGNVLPMFALEDELQGRGIDDNYAANAPVQVWVPGRGDVVYAVLADNENVTRGEWLVSNGNGELKAKTSFGSQDSFSDVEGGNTIVGQAIESLDLSDSSGTWPAARRRIKVRIY